MAIDNDDWSPLSIWYIQSITLKYNKYKAVQKTFMNSIQNNNLFFILLDIFYIFFNSQDTDIKKKFIILMKSSFLVQLQLPILMRLSYIAAIFKLNKFQWLHWTDKLWTLPIVCTVIISFQSRKPNCAKRWGELITFRFVTIILIFQNSILQQWFEIKLNSLQYLCSS